MPHSLQANLLYAGSAVTHVRQAFHLGAANKPADVERSRKQHDRQREKMGFFQRMGDYAFGGPPLTQEKLDRQRGPMSRAEDATLDSICRDAEVAEASGMGNCGEQASSALRYLVLVQHYSPICYVTLGSNHAFLILDVTEDTLRGARPYRTDSAPALGPSAVVCDPWRPRSAYPVATDWVYQVSETLKVTEPARYAEPAGKEVHLGLIYAYE